MKFAHTSDWHLGRRHLNLQERYLDNFRAARRMINQAILKQVDFVVHAGDFFEQASPSAMTYNLSFRILNLLKEKSIPIYVVRGNHDASQYRLKDNALHVLQNAGFIKLVENDKITFDCDGTTVSIFGIGYAGRNYEEQLRNVLERYPLNRDHYNILMLHASVSGLEYSDNRAEFEDDADAHFSVKNLLSYGFDYIALGHHHRTSIVRSDSGIAAYSGATEHWNISNWEDGWTVDKNWLFAKYDNKSTDIETVAFPVRHKHGMVINLQEMDMDPKSQIDYINELLEIANQRAEKMQDDKGHFKAILSYIAYLGFNQIEYDNPFMNWKELIPNLLTKGCYFKFYDPEVVDQVFKTKNEHEIIDEYLEQRYPKSKDMYSDLIKMSLLIYGDFNNKEERIDELQTYLEEKLNVKD